METLAWIGVATLSILLAVAAITWVVGMLSNPIGRAFMTVVALLVIAVWGVLGALYLVAENSS